MFEMKLFVYNYAQSTAQVIMRGTGNIMGIFFLKYLNQVEMSIYHFLSQQRSYTYVRCRDASMEKMKQRRE